MLTKKIKNLLIICLVINIAAIFIIGIGAYSYATGNENIEVVVMDMKEDTKVTQPQDKKDFIDVEEFIPEVVIELQYATSNNIAGKVLYKDEKAYLRRGTAQKLKLANDELMKHGFRIKIWDAYRPTAVQYELWKKVPDTRYIADPKRGSIHSRGAAVDITLVDENDMEVVMPTGFDGFSAKGDRDYRDISPKAAEAALLLQGIMLKYGFKGAETEWWHYSDTEWNQYPLADKVLLSKEVEGFSIEIASLDDERNESNGVISSVFSKVNESLGRLWNYFGYYNMEE